MVWQSFLKVPFASPVPVSGMWAMCCGDLSHYRWLAVACCWGQHNCFQCDQHRWVLSHTGNSWLNHHHSWLSRLLLKHPQLLTFQQAELEWAWENANLLFIQVHFHSLLYNFSVCSLHAVNNKDDQRLVSTVKTFYYMINTQKLWPL